MAPVLKRRKILDAPTSRIQNISSFAKISKASVVTCTKECLADDSEQERKHKPAQKPVPKSRKRQREVEPEDGGLREYPGNIVRFGQCQKQDLKSVTPKKKVRFTGAENKEKEEERTQHLLQTPTKLSRTLLEDFTISTPRKPQDIFDEETQDLIDLHNAFLNVLAIHYAHNGIASPIDVKALIPKIELKWSKRQLTIEDIQLILGIQHNELKSPLRLAQRSQSRIWLDFDSSSPTTTLPIESLKKSFLRAVRTLPSSNHPLEPIIIIDNSASTSTTTTLPHLSKGAKRLQDLRAAAASNKSAQVSSPASSTPSTIPASKRATSLLDRILLKQSLASAAGPGPTPDSLARKAALQRMEEIIPILSVLSSDSSSSATSGLGSGLRLGSGPARASGSGYSSQNLNFDSLLKAPTTTTAKRDPLSLVGLGTSLGIESTPRTAAGPVKIVSFTMSAIVQHLQGSMRHPISREECERAIRVLANEVAPRWCGVREVGSIAAVTFRGLMGRREWGGRVEELLKGA